MPAALCVPSKPCVYCTVYVGFLNSYVSSEEGKDLLMDDGELIKNIIQKRFS